MLLDKIYCSHNGRSGIVLVNYQIQKPKQTLSRSSVNICKYYQFFSTLQQPKPKQKLKPQL